MRLATRRQQAYVQHEDAPGYTRALLALLAQRRGLQQDTLRGLMSGSPGGRADGPLPPSLFAAQHSVKSLEAERIASQAELCALPACREESLTVDQMAEQLQRATHPLSGASYWWQVCYNEASHW